MRAQQSAAGQGGQREKSTPEQIWIRQLACRMRLGKVLVAIANKHARQLWTMLAHDLDIDLHASLKQPMVQHPTGKHVVTIAATA